jgi:hypothetical protein
MRVPPSPQEPMELLRHGSITHNNNSDNNNNNNNNNNKGR